MFVERPTTCRRLVAYGKFVLLLIDGALQDEIASSSDEETEGAPSLGDTIAGKTKPKKGSKDVKGSKPAAVKGKVRTITRSSRHSILFPNLFPSLNYS